MLIYALFQHVFLANVPERLPAGARVGGLLYDLAIAYSGAFIFYLLVVRLPLQRDRENTYRLIQPLTMGIISLGHSLMTALNQAAGVRLSRPHSRDNVDGVCRSIGLASPAFPGADELRRLNPHALRWIDESTTVADVINQHVIRARDLNREMLGFSSLLSSAMVNLIACIDGCNFFQLWDGYRLILSRGNPPNPNLTDAADALFEYLQLVELLNRYLKKFLPGEPWKPPGLSDIADPLSEYTIGDDAD